MDDIRSYDKYYLIDFILDMLYKHEIYCHLDAIWDENGGAMCLPNSLLIESIFKEIDDFVSKRGHYNDIQNQRRHRFMPIDENVRGLDEYKGEFVRRFRRRIIRIEDGDGDENEEVKQLERVDASEA